MKASSRSSANRSSTNRSSGSHSSSSHAPAGRSSSGQIRAAPTPFAALHRPLILGASIGHPSGMVGSIGPFVRLADGRTGFMAGSYVLAPAGSSIGDWIHQPGPYDAAVLTGATRIGRLAGIAPPHKEGLSYTAAAVVALDVPVEGNVIPELAKPGAEAGRSIAGVSDAHLGDEVAFVGCTSGYSIGRVSVVALHLPVGGFTFADVIEIEAEDGHFSAPGDGGALLFRCSDMMAVGLLFARTKRADGRSISYALPLQPSLAALGVSLKLGDGA